MTNTCRAASLLLLIGLWIGTVDSRIAAQATQEAKASATASEIQADSKPYHMEWNGVEGSFSQEALGVDTPRKVPLVFLHSDPGPKGYSKYLAWFLARDGETYSLLWCYLNDSGTDFYCWLYRYPVNLITPLHFTGNYRFTAPVEPVAPVVQDMKAANTPHYSGPDFTYGNWTRRSGTLAKLDLLPTRAATFAAPLTDRPADANAGGAPVKTLTGLRAYPLHEINVPGGNGWRTTGWRELHAMAYDSAGDPYYLILYTNSTRGYVVDLKRAQTYVADYGQPVVFSQSPTTFGQEEQVTGPPTNRVLRYTRHEIEFTATGAYANPYNEVYLDVQFRSPDGTLLTVPGFWDGGTTWHARISPTLVGQWTWKTISSDPGMHQQEGGFTCVSEPTEGKGFLTLNTARGYRHHFATTDGTPFLPVFVAFPVHHLPDGETQGGNAPDKTAAVSTGVRLASAADPAAPDSFARFQRDIDVLAGMGFNRFIGEFLIDPVSFAARTQRNEGGAPFSDYDPDRINPAYFQWMDKRLAYANAHGIVPDVGLGQLDAGLLDLLNQAQVKRLWRYVIARYSAYNVNWMPFGRSIGKPMPPDAPLLIDSIQKTAARYDPVRHPFTLVSPGGVPVPPKPARAAVATDTPAAPALPDTIAPEQAGHVNPANPEPATGGFVRIPEAQPGVAGTNGAAAAVGRSAAQGAPTTGAVPGSAAGQAAPAKGGKGTTRSTATSKTGSKTRSARSARSRGRAAKGKTTAAPKVQPAVRSAAPMVNITPAAGNPGNPAGTPGRSFAPPSGGPPTGSFPGAPPNGSFPGGPPTGRFPGAPPNGSFSGGPPNGRFPGGPGGFPGGLPGFGAPGGAQDAGAFFRGRNRGAGRGQGQTTAGNYIQSPSGLPLGPATTSVARTTTPQVTLEPVPSWMDVITLNGGPVSEIAVAYSQDKPIVIYDQSAPAEPGATRYRLWTTLMSGGYWAPDFPGDRAIAALDSNTTRWTSYAGRLLARSRYWRLVPHNDMLGGLQETAFERRRRRQAEAAAAKEAAAQDAAKGIEPDDSDPFGDNAPTTGPIYVLADPGWEYIVYFQRGGILTLDLLEATGRVSYVWFNPRTGEFSNTESVLGGAFRSFRAPDDNDWALYISRR